RAPHRQAGAMAEVERIGRSIEAVASRCGEVGPVRRRPVESQAPERAPRGIPLEEVIIVFVAKRSQDNACRLKRALLGRSYVFVRGIRGLFVVYVLPEEIEAPWGHLV